MLTVSYQLTESLRQGQLQYLIACETQNPPCIATFGTSKLCSASGSGQGKLVTITLGAHAQRGYGSWVCVCVFTLHLTSRMFVRLTKDTTYLTGNEGQKFRTVFSETAPLQSYSAKKPICKYTMDGDGLLPSDRSACSAYLGGTIRCKAGHVSPLACYLVV